MKAKESLNVKRLYTGSKEKMEQGMKVLLHLLNHESAVSVRKLIYKFLLHLKAKLVPLFKLATWVEVWRHPLAKGARIYAVQASKLLRMAVEELCKNLVVLLSLANTFAKTAAAKRLAENQKRSYSDLAATILSRLMSSQDRSSNAEQQNNDGKKEEASEAADLIEFESSPTIRAQASPMPLAEHFPEAKDFGDSPKEDIRSLSNLIDLTSPGNQGFSPNMTVPRMWQSYNPEDIKSCAKSTPACRAKYVEERSGNSETCSDSSVATANSSEDSNVIISTPESVNIDMTVYSTGTPFKENVQNIQEQCQTLDFSKVDLNPSPARQQRQQMNPLLQKENDENVILPWD